MVVLSPYAQLPCFVQKICTVYGCAFAINNMKTYNLKVITPLNHTSHSRMCVTLFLLAHLLSWKYILAYKLPLSVEVFVPGHKSLHITTNIDLALIPTSNHRNNEYNPCFQDISMGTHPFQLGRSSKMTRVPPEGLAHTKPVPRALLIKEFHGSYFTDVEPNVYRNQMFCQTDMELVSRSQ